MLMAQTENLLAWPCNAPTEANKVVFPAYALIYFVFEYYKIVRVHICVRTLCVIEAFNIIICEVLRISNIYIYIRKCILCTRLPYDLLIFLHN